MITNKQLHWLGEVGGGLVGLGIVFLFLRAVDGVRLFRPLLPVPLIIRVVLAFLVVILYASVQTRRHYRRGKASQEK